MANLTGSTTAVFFVRLSTAVDEIVDVDWNTRDGTAIAGQDYEAASGTVSFLPGETEKAIDVVVYGQDDVLANGKKFYIELKPPANAVLTDALAECVITVADEDGVLFTSLVIAQGKRGFKGNPGLSAYEQAVLMGYEGTVEQWMEKEANAARAAERAEAAAVAANIASKVFASPESGVNPNTGVPVGDYFNVRSPLSTHYVDEYQNIGGAAIPTGKSYPSATGLENAIAATEANAIAAEMAATAANIAGKVYSTPEAGVDPVTGVGNGAYYNVRSPSDESYIDEYQNVDGVPTPSGKSYPSAAAVSAVSADTAQVKSAVEAITDPNTGNVVADKVVTANGKSLEDVTVATYDPALVAHGWTQKDFNDSVIDVRKFIKKDLSNVTTGLQAAIEAAYGQTLYIPIPLQVLDTMYVESGLSILGVNRSVSNYNTDLNVLDFSLLGAGKSAFEIATTSPVIGFQLEKLFLRGAKNGGQALKIGASLTNNLADFNIKDLIIYNFSNGIEQQYCWDGRYENMRIQACTNGIAHNSQSNVIHYDKCAIVTINNLALTFFNSEGVQFDCCDISNLTKTNGAPITLFQSAVAFNTGYFENISNANLALVGTISEVTGSRLTFNTPFKLANNILCGSNIAFVDIKQPDSNDVKVVGATLTTEANAIVAKRNNGLVNKSVFLWHAKKPLTITGYGGVTATYQDYRNYLLLNSTSAAGGWNVTNSLEVGKAYTVIYSIRSTANTVGLGLRHPSAQSTLRSSAVGEAVTIKTVSFVATSSTLNMTWQGDIELYGIQIVEGNLSAMANDPFLQSDFSQPVTISRSAVPTVGTWRVGDKVENINPTTHMGWICTVAGSPGTWKQYGAIV